MKGYFIEKLTKKEYLALCFIIGNGWGDGDFRGYGGQNPKVQVSAMKKFDEKAKLINYDTRKTFYGRKKSKILL